MPADKPESAPTAPTDREPQYNSSGDRAGSQPPPPTPEALAGGLKDKSGLASQGDATSAQSLATQVQDMLKDGKLNDVGKVLQQDGSAQVLKDANGQVSELIFNANSGHPVDVKIGSGGEVSVNGKDKEQLQAADTAYLKQYMAESVKGATDLSPEAKEQVTKLENALLDGDSKAFIEGVKALHGNEELAQQVATRLNSDMQPTNVHWTADGDGKGGGSIQVQYYGDPQTITRVSTDGKASAEVLDWAGKTTGKTTDAVAALSAVGKEFNQFGSNDVGSHHANLRDMGQLPKIGTVTPEDVADQQVLFDNKLFEARP